jgi:UPF0755 protein
MIPSVVVWHESSKKPRSPFPVSVDPPNKTIHSNPQADALFATPTPAEAAAAGADSVFELIGSFISSTGLYQMAAAANFVPGVVTVNPGMRKEQVAAIFGKQLDWDSGSQKMFASLPPVSNQDLNEGTIPPGSYTVSENDSIIAVQTQVKDRFRDEVLSRYTAAVQQVVPLDEGLTIASIIERETSDPSEMRIVSGIIWNRLFAGMKLQMDSTLQYAKATPSRGVWWPEVNPQDKYIDSPYNTYQHEGLPPGPIAEPSTAAVLAALLAVPINASVLAALNPVKTSCLYYFYDDNGTFHCSATYTQHIAKLKQIYGQGR